MILGVFIFAVFYLPAVLLFNYTERPRYKVFCVLIVFWYSSAVIVATSFHYSWFYFTALRFKMEGGGGYSFERAKNIILMLVFGFVGCRIFITTWIWQDDYFERLRLNAPEEYEDIFN